MNEDSQPNDESCTLDPPGTITVIGAGVLGIEAALYGRFLGYNVQVLESERVGARLLRQPDEDLPLLPNRFLSALALSALQAQRGEALPPVPPTTRKQWVEEMLVPLTETDLMRGRVRIDRRVTEIAQLPVDPDEDEEVPPDFRLTAQTADGTTESIDTEAVIVAAGDGADVIQLGFDPDVPYFFQIGADPGDDWEEDLTSGRREITALYATLAGRTGLDLYRPRRV